MVATPEEVWRRYQKDAYFLLQPPAVQAVMQQYVEALPTLLYEKGMFEQQATLSMIMEAKILFLEYCLQHAFIQNMIKVTPKDSVDGIFLTFEELPKILEGALVKTLEYARQLTGEALVQTLQKYSITEAQIVCSQQMGLSYTTSQMYLANLLTIERLLLVQPGVIINNPQS